MLKKITCQQCKSTAMVDTSTGPRVKCPRCGAVQDVAGSQDADPSMDSGALVSDMLETQAQAEQRHRVEAQAAAEQADRQRRESHFAHQRQAAERMTRLGGKSSGANSLGWAVGVFAVVVGALIGYRVMVGFFDARKAHQAAAEQMGAFASLEDGQRISGAVERWVRSLSAGITHDGGSYHVYHVSFDSVEERGGGLLLVEGAMHAADRQLTGEEITGRVEALREAKEKGQPQDSEGLGSLEGGDLQQSVGVMRDSYDPQRMSEIASGRRDLNAASGAGEKPQADAADGLRSMGFEFDDESPSDFQEITRPFICVVRRDAETESFGGGVAMDYFVWARHAQDGSVSVIDDPQVQQPFAKVINYVLESLRDGGGGWRTYVNASNRRTPSDLFPALDRPESWTIARYDRNSRDAVRAFVRVKTQNAQRSGTWILTLLPIGSDGGYRIVDVWRTAG